MKLFKLNDMVYHITDEMQRRGMVTGILERPNGYVYLVAFGVEMPEQECFATEIQFEKQYF